MSTRTTTPLALAIVLLAAPLAASAGTRTGTVSIVGTFNASRPLLQIVHDSSSSESGTPPCNTSGEFVFDLSTESGREAANIARLAKALGRQLSVGGTGACTLSPGREDGGSIAVF